VTDAGKFMLGKNLSDKQISWSRRRRFWMAMAGITPTASQLTKISKIQSAGCRAQGLSADILAVETYGQINSAGWEGMATTIT